MRVSLVGIPGAGKTTIAKILSDEFNAAYISSGVLARAHGFAGSKAEQSGALDPNEAKIRRLVTEAIGNSNHYILDGFPRMIEQVEEVDIPIDAVIYLKVPWLQIGVDRLIKRGRPDDKYDIITKRMATYYEHTHPLVDYFEKKGKLVVANASKSIGHTFSKVIAGLANRNIIEAENYKNRIIYEVQKNRHATDKRKAGKREST